MNTFSAVLFVAAVSAVSAGYLGGPVAVAPAATYSTFGARISQSARPVAYAQAPVAYAQAPVAYAPQVAYAAPAPVAYAPAPVATYSTFKNRVSQSARPLAYAAPAFAAPAYAAPAYAHAPVAVAHAAPLAAPAYSSIAYGYNGAIASTLLH